jgi:hypothetical protein
VITVGYFDIELSSINRSSKQKNQQRNFRAKLYHRPKGAIDIYQVFHPAAVGYIFFSQAHRTFSNTEHTLDSRASLYKYKKTNNFL